MSEQIKFLQGCHECYRHNRHHSVLYNTSDCRCRRGGYVKSSKSASQSTGMRFLFAQYHKQYTIHIYTHISIYNTHTHTPTHTLAYTVEPIKELSVAIIIYELPDMLHGVACPPHKKLQNKTKRENKEHNFQTNFSFD